MKFLHQKPREGRAGLSRRFFVLAVGLLAVASSLVFAQEPQLGGTLEIARPSDSVSLDPNRDTTAPGGWVYYNIFEPLVRITPDGEILPHLATTWEQVDDRTIRFNLRQDVTFHDGTPLNAEAVKFTVDRIFRGDPPATGAALFGPPAEAEVVDEYTVEISTPTPYAPLLRSFAMPYAGIVSPAAVERWGGDFGRNPVGTGPFEFVEWRTNDRISLRRNENYWGDGPYVDQVIFRVIPEDSVRMIALETGEVDMVMHPSPAELPFFEDNPDFTVHRQSGDRVIYFGFNTGRAPTDDVRVRQALTHAVDIDAILDNILEGTVDPAYGYIARSVFGFAETDMQEKYQYDPALATTILEEAGYLNGGQPLTLNVLAFRGRYLRDAEIIEAVIAYWNAIGVRTEVEWLEWAAAFTQVRSADFPYNAFLLQWAVANLDGDYALYSLYEGDELPPRGWNVFRFNNEQFNELVREARTATDPERRLELYAQAQQILVDSFVEIPIYEGVNLVLSGSHVRGLALHAVEYNLDLSTVWLDE